MAEGEKPDKGRRLLLLGTAGMGVVAASGAVWVLIDSLNPAADVAGHEWFDIDDIAVGKYRIIEWRVHRPIIVHRRTPEQIRSARDSELRSRYPEIESKRTQDPTWFIAYAICTYGDCLVKCSPTGPEGWLCPCCGSRYDLSRRIIQGPAPSNLGIPPYRFGGATELRLG